MTFIDEDKKTLMRRLEKKGMAKGATLGFIWSLKSCILDNPEMNRQQIEKRLKYLGWKNFQLDDETFQMAIKCFKIRPSENTDKVAYPV